VVLSPLVDIPSHGQTGIKWKPTCFSNPLRFSALIDEGNVLGRLSQIQKGAAAENAGERSAG
jgi:hypothetical protein